MPALDNPRHELFAQEMAKGNSASEAYILAGYAANDGNSIRLKGNERVAKRVSELMERAATRTEISVASVTEALLRIAATAEALRDAPGLSVARAAQMDAAKLNGLVVEKVQADVNATTVIEKRVRDDLEWLEKQVAGGKPPDDGVLSATVLN